MTIENPWLLPQGIEEVLPEEAGKLEHLRREILDLHRAWGYELVMPPFIEFIESLLGDLGNDLALKTFKLTDQLSGRLMGVRADMTPQVARIDAHVLNRNVPTRLCYMGTVLHTRSDEFAASRSPLQVGCELYGHAGPESDVEVIRVMIATLQQAGIRDLTIDLGHVGVYRGLVQQAGLSAAQEAELFDKLQRKSIPEISAWLAEQNLSETSAKMLLALANLNGGPEVLSRARVELAQADAEVLAAIDMIERVQSLLAQQVPGLSYHIDLAELHGYHYKTGIVFTAYLSHTGQEIARGGRYDEIGKAFGRARPATGFSTDLKTLVRLGSIAAPARQPILAPEGAEPELLEAIQQLRSQGEIVIAALPNADVSPADLGCGRQLVQRDDTWMVEAL